MHGVVQSAGASHNIVLFGVHLLGVRPENGRKLLLTAIFLLTIIVFSKLLRALAHLAGRKQKSAFWARQGISIITFIVGVLGFVSIWFDNPARFATAMGLVTAGLAFALQKVVTSFAGYIVILRGKTFNVGDRITMGGVRGDVIALNFLQTVIMEMGEPPAVQADEPGMWVQSRQYSGRIVAVSNSEIFDNPVYNYTRDFPYIWEEMHIPISYKDNRAKAEEILLHAAQAQTVKITELAEPALTILRTRFFIEPSRIEPRVYYRLTDNWIELSVRFLCHDHDIRALKDSMSREILDGFEKAGISIASATYDIVGFPPISVRMEDTGRKLPANAA